MRPRTRQTPVQVILAALLSGVLFTALMTLFQLASDELSVGSLVFQGVFFTAGMTGWGFVMRAMTPAEPATGS